MIKNNLDIFVCSHKQYISPVSNEIYKTLSLGNNKELYGDDIIRDNSGDNISDMNKFYCELTGMYWIWKNYDIKDYVGFCHYRRYFDFLDNIPEDINEYDIILPKPLNLGTSIYNQYKSCHNIDDIDIIETLIITKYDVPVSLVQDIFHDKIEMYSYNMFIMTKKLFNEFCTFTFNVLQDYLKIREIVSINDVQKLISTNSVKYLKNFYPNNTIEYQSRIGGYLSERLLNIFISMKDLKIKTINVLELK